jgi:hypothetical protein
MSNVVPLRRNMPPEELDLDDALRLVFPGYEPARGVKPRRSWKAGKRPRLDGNSDETQRLERLDNVVWAASNARDRGNRKAIKLLSEQELTKRGISCPYFYARLGVAHAVNQAGLAEKDYNYRKTHRSREQEILHDATSKALEGLDSIIQNYTPFDLTNLINTTGRFGHSIGPYVFHDEYERIADSYAVIGKATKALTEILHSIGTERDKYVKNGDPDVWVACFITAVGHLWTDLTGEVPTARGVFSNFLSSCYMAVGGDRVICGVRRIETSVNAIPTESNSDKNWAVVPPRYLLLCEIQSNETIHPDDAEAIRKAVEFEDEDPEATIEGLCKTGRLPPAVEALARCLPLSSIALAASTLGIPSDEAKEAIAGIEFD